MLPSGLISMGRERNTNHHSPSSSAINSRNLSRLAVGKKSASTARKMALAVSGVVTSGRPGTPQRRGQVGVGSSANAGEATETRATIISEARERLKVSITERWGIRLVDATSAHHPLGPLRRSALWRDALTQNDPCGHCDGLLPVAKRWGGGAALLQRRDGGGDSLSTVCFPTFISASPPPSPRRRGSEPPPHSPGGEQGGEKAQCPPTTFSDLGKFADLASQLDEDRFNPVADVGRRHTLIPQRPTMSASCAPS